MRSIPTRGQDAELVALGVREHHPGDVVALTDVDPLGAETDQTLDLSGLIRRPEVEVEPVLADLLVRHLHEQDVRRNVDRRVTLRRLDRPLGVALVGDRPAQDLRPEPGEPFAIVAVDDDALDPDVHRATPQGITDGSRCPEPRAPGRRGRSGRCLRGGSAS
jgi:hypothetical protein